MQRSENNFGLLRLCAAFFVLISHSAVLSGNDSMHWDACKFFFNMNMGWFGVVSFFIISGFLVASSWDRSPNIISFGLSRVLRMYPAAIVIIIVSVLLSGAFFTHMPLIEFFQHSDTLNYLKNMSLIRVFYNLPGVFESNPHPMSINGSLWTLPYEITCYLIILLLGSLSLLSKKGYILVVWLAVLAGHFVAQQTISEFIIPYLEVDLKTLHPLLMYFLSGTVFYYFRSRIQYSICSLLLSFGLLVVLSKFSVGYYFSLILLPYFLLSIAFAVKPVFATFFAKTDLSYGLYLFAFPAQQALVAIFNGNISALLLTVLTSMIVVPSAYFSWHFIEKPSLDLRKKFRNSKQLFKA